MGTFDPTRAAEEYLPLVRFTLDATTLRVSKRTVVLDDGTVYYGWLRDIAHIQRSAGDLLAPRLVTPDAALVLDDADGQISAQLKAATFANREVVVDIGHGVAAANYETAWKAVVRHPGGIRKSGKHIIIDLSDVRSKDSRRLPSGIINADDYPNAEAKSLGMRIPTIYGDFTSSAGAQQVPAYQTDSTVGTGGEFALSGRTLKSIEAVYKNGASVSFTAGTLNKTFTLNVSYDPAVDVVTAHVQGHTDDDLTTGTLLETFGACAQDLLVNEVGVSLSTLDTDAFDDWDTDYGSHKVRRWIGGPEGVESDDLLAELLLDGFADIVVEGGLYTPKYRTTTPGESLTTVYESNLLPTQDGRDFSWDEDPEGIFANDLTAAYNVDPTTGAQAQYHHEENAGSIARVQSRVHRNLYLTWTYRAADAAIRTQRELTAFSADVIIARAGLNQRTILKTPTQQIALQYDRFEVPTPFMIRSGEYDYERMVSTLLLWNLALLGAFVWTEDGSTTWLTATAEQRTLKCFWTDDDGYADTSGSPDEASRIYKWN